MKDFGHETESHADGELAADVDMESDALCAKCGTVNPDGVSECVSCGNDLRQQHAQRLTQEQPAESAVRREQRTQILLSALSFAGIVAVILVAWNVTRIADWVTTVGGVGNPAVTFWRGDDAERFVDLSRSARDVALSANSVQEIMEADVVVEDLNGRYLITRQDADREVMVGTAAVEQANDRLYFAAWVLGEIELRGVARVDGERQRLALSEGGARYQGEYRQIFGFASPAEGNTFMCSGQIEGVDLPVVEGRAYPIP